MKDSLSLPLAPPHQSIRDSGQLSLQNVGSDPFCHLHHYPAPAWSSCLHGCCNLLPDLPATTLAPDTCSPPGDKSNPFKTRRITARPSFSG